MDPTTKDAEPRAPVLPELPPGRRLNAGLTLEETLADLKKLPLFMTELDDSGDNEQLAGLQALAYDGTPLENATNFKEQGNDSFREKRWADAKEFYGKGIAVLAAEEFRRAKGITRQVKKAAPPPPPPTTLDTAKPDMAEVLADSAGPPTAADLIDAPDTAADTAAERALLETLHVNRAACHLALRNHRACTLDCAAALRLNPSNLKALYRSARALLATARLPEADDACARGLQLDPANPPLLALAADITAAAARLATQQHADAARATAAGRRAVLLRTALAARGVRLRASGARAPEMEDARVRLAPDELDAASAVVFPTLLLYPCHAESDFIKAFSERESLAGHFGYVFPLPWDRAGEYRVGAVECFVETETGGLVKVGAKVPLLEVLGAGTGVVVVDELVKVFVVPTARVKGWVAEWKERKAREGR
ncbi:TPR-like protein [Trichocladium antarcticum]|uniref:TPR-like protein n=1 Tax=Trichocladium antarcticum TaxID=1450529 RepID=A0AAN6UDH1_9PEZI|nr:TPR-like protein [Trichocladium antarcticum]